MTGEIVEEPGQPCPVCKGTEFMIMMGHRPGTKYSFSTAACTKCRNLCVIFKDKSDDDEDLFETLGGGSGITINMG